MLIVAIENHDLPEYLTKIREILLVISIIIIAIPILSSINLGFQDAVHLNRLNKGSYWIVISMIISIGITFLYLIFPSIIGICQKQELESTVFQYIYNYLELIYRYRQILVAFVLGLVSVISISISLARELKVKSYNIPNIPNTVPNRSIFFILFTNIGNITKMVIQGIQIVSNLMYQILIIIFEEIFKLIKDTIYRTVLIFFRFLRVTFIIISAALLSVAIEAVSYFVNKLWKSSDFLAIDGADYFLFLLLCVISCFLILTISMLTYRKWKEFTDLSIGFKRIFFSVLGSKDDALVAYRSVTMSIFMYAFYFLLSFFGAWSIINPVHYLLGLKYANPIGFLFVFSAGLIVISGIINWFIKK
jgi:hypothetical protein